MAHEGDLNISFKLFTEKTRLLMERRQSNHANRKIDIHDYRKNRSQNMVNKRGDLNISSKNF